MSELDPTDLVISDVREAVRRIPTPRPDFADVVARANAMSPGRVSEAAVEDAEGCAEVITLGRGTAGEEAALDELIGDARSGMQARIDEHRLRPVPPMRSVPTPTPARRMGAGLLLVAGLAAAAVVAAIGLRSDFMIRDDGAEMPAQAVREEIGAEPTHEAVERTPELPAKVRPTPTPEDEEPALETEPELAPAPVAKASTPHGDRLRAMADEAQAKWRAGDLAGAREIYGRIIARGGRSRQAELAYSDLFSLSHQMGSASERRRWWRGYVKRFPRGRFADDARAGLCRTEAAAKRAACWERYLEQSGGSYRDEARRAIVDGTK